jgi:hypothetical protein
MNLEFDGLRHSRDCVRAHLPARYDRGGETLTLPPCTCERDVIVGRAIQREASLTAERDRVGAERDAARLEVERLTHQNQRLIGALRVTATVAILAQCPVCLAERTNGEWHDEDCPLVGE